jgi:hypothetical protein
LCPLLGRAFPRRDLRDTLLRSHRHRRARCRFRCGRGIGRRRGGLRRRGACGSGFVRRLGGVREGVLGGGRVVGGTWLADCHGAEDDGECGFGGGEDMVAVLEIEWMGFIGLF